MAQRDLFWDMLKGTLIILVVLGHIMQLSPDSLSIALVNWIYSFHMPLFILISGYFSNPQSNSYKQGICKIAETFVIFQMLRSYIEEGVSMYNLLFPCMAMWYLLSLVYWKSLLLVVPNRIRSQKSAMLIFSVVLCFVAGFVPVSTILSFQRTFTFLPFFVLGYVIRDFDYRLYLSKISIKYAILGCVASLIIAYGLNTSILGYFAGTMAVEGGNFLISKLMILCTGIVMSLCIMRIMLRLPPSVYLQYLGKHTLHVYIYHAFFYMYLLKPCVEAGTLSNSFLSMLMCTIGVLIILYNTTKIQFMNIILNPFSYMFNLWKTR